jgi:hypothetical protein
MIKALRIKEANFHTSPSSYKKDFLTTVTVLSRLKPACHRIWEYQQELE